MSERGQALIEFALVLPLLLVLALGIVELTEIGIARLTLEHAAAEAARTGALTNDDLLIRETVSGATSPLDPAAVAVTIVPPADAPGRSGDPRGTLVRVDLGYDVAIPLAFAGLPRVHVRGSAARRIEWTP
ncbi:MAG: pilus assembly protein [Chloroflexi bacterium]|nr:pilus assembly protein [Chloroflexota bacterium]